MSEEKISREEFDQLFVELQEYSKELAEHDRHERGGTTIGEMFSGESPVGEGFADAWVSIFRDPEYLKEHVNRYLDWWCGERGGWHQNEGNFLKSLRPPGIALLGLKDRFGNPVQTPEEIGMRASRAKSMTHRKAEHRIPELYEIAKLLIDLADVFEQRLEDEAGIRRVK
jgi:hypothetical protein